MLQKSIAHIIMKVIILNRGGTIYCVYCYHIPLVIHYREADIVIFANDATKSTFCQITF